MISIGVTGAMGCGKTTVSAFFGKMGAEVLNADRIAKDFLKKPEVKRKIRALFGRGVFLGAAVNPGRLARVVFADKRMMRRLTSIIHPMVIGHIASRIARKKSGIAVVDAPLLIESGLNRRMDYLVVVRAKPSSRMKRCLRGRYRAEEVTRRMKMQMTESQKLKRADFVIVNDGTVSEARAEAVRVWVTIKNDIKSKGELNMKRRERNG